MKCFNTPQALIQLTLCCDGLCWWQHQSDELILFLTSCRCLAVSSAHNEITTAGVSPFARHLLVYSHFGCRQRLVGEQICPSHQPLCSDGAAAVILQSTAKPQRLHLSSVLSDTAQLKAFSQQPLRLRTLPAWTNTGGKCHNTLVMRCVTCWRALSRLCAKFCFLEHGNRI